MLNVYVDSTSTEQRCFNVEILSFQLWLLISLEYKVASTQLQFLLTLSFFLTLIYMKHFCNIMHEMGPWGHIKGNDQLTR